MFQNFSTACRSAILCARAEASRLGSTALDTEHLLLGLMLVDSPLLAIVAFSQPYAATQEAARRWSKSPAKIPTSMDLPLSEDAGIALTGATSVAESYQSSMVRTEHLLLSLMGAENSHAATLLCEINASLGQIEEQAAALPRVGDQEDSGSWQAAFLALMSLPAHEM